MQPIIVNTRSTKESPTKSRYTHMIKIREKYIMINNKEKKHTKRITPTTQIDINSKAWNEINIGKIDMNRHTSRHKSTKNTNRGKERQVKNKEKHSYTKQNQQIDRQTDTNTDK